MKTDIEIAQAAIPQPIQQIADALGLPAERVEPYGRYAAKILPSSTAEPRKGKLILVTAINPTPAGEGKTTVSVGLADGMRKIGKKAVLALREPSLGPVFGVKGGAAGGGYAQVIPMEDINLHFTGDLHAITTANNLLAAMTDNHLQQGNALNIDPRRVTIRRCLDMNDRQLRFAVTGMGGKANGVPREEGFDITAASEVMATLCLASDIADLKARLGCIVAGYTYSGEPVTAAQLGADGAMCALLYKAIHPNLVQTLEGTPALIHGGPFANIAHGCNSVIATKTALSLGDYCVTEAGFGADLGAEKFLDIKCRMAGLVPNAVVLVATVRALKYHGGVPKAALSGENLTALKAGLANLGRHIENLQSVYGLNAVVAINRFSADTAAELQLIRAYCKEQSVPAALCEGWEKGGAGATELAALVAETCDKPSAFRFSYEDALPLEEKIRAVATKIYHAAKVSFAPAALSELRRLDGSGNYPVCIAKTQYSFSDNPQLIGAPEGFTLSIRGARLSAGAGFVVAYAGDIITMPGLPPRPAAEGIDVDAAGNITGLF
ncbi:MAG: formate--tetrahydrofolate ligase [Oscillospiraceae bacterium]|jgi:formate--tetrahydrofolate ligase|nr:formate--tetrahydrofolate ligase [Oscillospiraceae bacterium]